MNDQQWDLLLQNLANLKTDVHYCRKEIGNIKKEIGNLKGRSAVWGFVAGAVVSVVSALIGLLK